MDISRQIADLATPGAEAAGLIVDGVAVAPAGKRTRVTITLDLPETEVGSASLDAIAVASRAIGAALDEANVPKSEYTLEVSTPGTDRTLTERRHFMRARTRLVTLDLAEGATASGRLVDVTDDSVVLEIAGERSSFALADIADGRIEVEMKKMKTAKFAEEDAPDGH
ncbi:ribosome maturation factor RimP [Demequina aurantiaca]|uniref:ribosome maturation factor RimP n=1 Tax=Demequina aurantiaca TaxID=676200 RepID=UPI003D3576F8